MKKARSDGAQCEATTSDDRTLTRNGRSNALPPGFGTSERKTGVKHAEVITAQLLQDERGWLRLAG